MTQKVAEATIRGKRVSFFTPPHPQPDFLWVDMEELAVAFLSEPDAKRMVSLAQKFDPDNRAVATAKSGDRIATIICHAMAQGFCGFIDKLHGDAMGNGPAYTDYCIASAGIEVEHGTLSFDGLVDAFHNNGGPFMSGIRAKLKGGGA